jgi:hypothetical protein
MMRIDFPHAVWSARDAAWRCSGAGLLAKTLLELTSGDNCRVSEAKSLDYAL